MDNDCMIYYRKQDFGFMNVFFRDYSEKYMADSDAVLP
jgi:hypothetical protein